MKRMSYCMCALLCVALVNCTPTKINTEDRNTLAASSLVPIGRTLLSSDQKLQLISSAVHFGFDFDGKQATLYASLPDANAHNYIQYTLDGVYQKKVRIEGNASLPIIITAPTDGHHTIWIYKTTEAHTGAILIEKVTGKNIRVVQPSNAPLIEFIGNSITCGAAADPADVPCGTGVYHDQHNAYFAYGPRAARALEANYILSSVSGIGVYRNWNSDGPTMPQVYEKTDFQFNSPNNWNFATYAPKIVSIALGTNDFSKGDGLRTRLPFDSAVFVQHYIDFVRLIKSKYPAAQIALLSSPMVNGEARIVLQHCLQAVEQSIDQAYPSDKKVAVFFFAPMQAHGCGGHPDIDDHAMMASELIPFLKKLL